MTALGLDSRPPVAHLVVRQEEEDEYVVGDLASGNFVVVPEVGARLVALFAAGRTVAEFGLGSVFGGRRDPPIPPSGMRAGRSLAVIARHRAAVQRGACRARLTAADHLGRIRGVAVPAGG